MKTKSEDCNFPLRLLMAFMANVETGQTGKDQKGHEEHAKATLDKVWNTSQFPALKAMLNNYEIVMDPVVYSSSLIDGGIARNTTFIMYNKISYELVICVAGTNMIDAFDWFTEDFDTENLVPWTPSIVVNGANNTGVATNGSVSAGTATALKDTWNTKGKKSGKSPIEWLYKFLQDSNKVSSIVVSGHSLGGAISPALAMALHDNQAAWNPNSLDLPITTSIFAGPTPGDSIWINYVSTHLYVCSTYNTSDVVPHAWELLMMSQIPKLYENIVGGNGEIPASPPEAATHLNDGKIVYWMVEWLTSNSEAISPNKYVRWSEDVPFDNGAAAPPDLYNKTTTKAGDLMYLLSPEARKHAGEICLFRTDQKPGEATNAQLIPYFRYFLEYLTLLGLNHIQQYSSEFFSSDVIKEFHDLMPGLNAGDIAPAIHILDELLANIAAYRVKHYKE